MGKTKKLATPDPKKRLIEIFVNKVSLPATVFITGACILVVEIVATRILSPYFGNTIFTVSSVISVVLTALSIGYVIGGRLADKNPRSSIFYGIIGLSGICILLLKVMDNLILPKLGTSLSVTSGPLISSVILFFIPSLLLGTLSPFAIKLQSMANPLTGIGSISGGIFFWSTLGSIFGSLMAGFVLIPHLGIESILVSVGIILVCLGTIPFVINRKKAFPLMIILAALTLTGISSPSDKNYVYNRDGLYEKVQIYDDFFKGRPTRFLQLDRGLSSAMDLETGGVTFDYTKYYSIYQAIKPDAKRALVIGGGAYSIPKALLSELPDAQVDVSEIEPTLYDLSKKYFNLTDSPRLTNYTEDGRRLLTDQDKPYDVIFSDVYYSLYSIPSHFTSQEFFKLAKSKLSDDGVFIANIIGSTSRQAPSLTLSEMRTFQSAFPNSFFVAVNSPELHVPQNIIFVGLNSDLPLDFESPIFKESPNVILQNLGQKVIDADRFELSKYALLTDDYAPAEHLNQKLLHDFGKARSRQADANEMMAIIEQQLRYGSRYPGSDGHEKTVKFIEAEMLALTGNVNIQAWDEATNDTKVELKNIVARLAPEQKNRIILGAHYDTKRFANLDKTSPNAPIPGANDGASGVAVLIELGRQLKESRILKNYGIDLVFFDGEEGLLSPEDGEDKWLPLGSGYFANNLLQFYPEALPKGAIIVDMVCDKDLKLEYESNSLAFAPTQFKRFWEIGQKINPYAFSSTKPISITDDHTALNNAGIPSFNIIDLDYPAFHTTKDTLDKCSANSLQTVSDTLQQYITTLP